MKKIFAIAFKDARMRFTGFTEWLFFFILPVIFTVVLAGGTGGGGDSRVTLVVADQAGSSLSADLIAALEDSASVRPEVLTFEKAQEEFDGRRVSAMLVIPPEFDLSHLQQGSVALELRQQPNSMNAMIARRAVLAVISRAGSAADIAGSSVAAAAQVRPFASAAEQQAYFDLSLEQARSLLAESPVRIAVSEGSTPDQIEYDPRANSSAGQLITWVFIPLIGLSELFAYERQKGTLRRILTTPTGKGTYLFGTVFGQVVIGLAQMSLLVGFGILFMKVNWGQDPAGLIVMLTSGALAAAALGTMLGTFVKTPAQASGISVMLGMVMALLGGCWYPLELFPAAVQQAVKVLPTTWAMQGLLDLVARGRGLADVLPEAGVLLGFAAVFFVVGIWRFKYE